MHFTLAFCLTSMFWLCDKDRILGGTPVSSSWNSRGQMLELWRGVEKKALQKRAAQNKIITDFCLNSLAESCTCAIVIGWSYWKICKGSEIITSVLAVPNGLWSFVRSTICNILAIQLRAVFSIIVKQGPLP